MRDDLRFFVVALFFFLSVSLQACSNSSPNTNVASPTVRTEQPTTNGNSNRATSSLPPSFEGYLDIANCDALIAWGWDMTKPNEPIKLDIYDGNVLVASVPADSFRQDLLDVGKGNGKHSMFWPIPVQMKDGKKHVITVKYGGSAIEIGTSPKEITCNF